LEWSQRGLDLNRENEDTDSVTTSRLRWRLQLRRGVGKTPRRNYL